MRNRVIAFLLCASMAHAAYLDVCASGCTYSTVQAAINAASCGDLIDVKDESLAGEWTLKHQGCTNQQTVIRGRGALLLPIDTRVTSSSPLTEITVSPAASLVTADPGADHWTIWGFHFKLTGSQDTYNMISFLHLGDYCGGCDDNNSLEKLPSSIIWRQNVVSGLNRNQGIFTNCMVTNTGFILVENSTFENCYNPGSPSNVEAHALIGWNQFGPMIHRNNQFQGSQIGTMVGGNVPTKNGLTVQGYIVKGNHFWRPATWLVATGTADPSNPCLYDASGGAWFNNTSSGHYFNCGVTETWVDQGVGTAPQLPTYDKNQFELKNANGVVVDGNVLQNSWGTYIMFNQNGGCILLNQVDYPNYSDQIRNVQFTRNNCNDTAYGYIEGIITDGTPYHSSPQNILLKGNQFTTGSPKVFAAETGQRPVIFQVNAFGNRTLDHNTALLDRDSVGGGTPFRADIASSGLTSINGMIWHYGGSVSNDSGGFSDSFSGAGSLWNAPYSMFGTNRQIGSSVWINQQSCTYSIYTCPIANNSAGPTSVPDDTIGYIAGVSNQTATSNSAVGFVNYSGGNYALDTGSPYRRAGFGGVDLGADISEMNQATATAVSGLPNPYLDFAVKYAIPGTTTASLGFTAPTTGTCTVALAPNPAGLSSPTYTNTDSGGARWRTLSITGLSAYTRYYMQITCDTTYTLSQFVMTRP